MSFPLRTDTDRALAALQPPWDVVEAFADTWRGPSGSDECIIFPARNDVDMEVEDVLPASCSVRLEGRHAVEV